MPSNHEAHILSLQLAFEGIEGELDQLGQAAGMFLLRGTVLKTPSDLGVLRNNWYLTIGQPFEGTTELEGASGSDAISRGLQAVSGLKFGNNLWLTNNSPYAHVWEFGTFVPPNPGPSKDLRPDRFGQILVAGGFSLQAPAGMLGLTIEEFQAQSGS